MKKKRNDILNAQGLVEYILVFLFAAVVMYYFAAKLDVSKLKNFAIYGIRNQSTPNKLIIPPMTD